MVLNGDDVMTLERRRDCVEAEVRRVGVLGSEIWLDLIFPFSDLDLDFTGSGGVCDDSSNPFELPVETVRWVKEK